MPGRIALMISVAPDVDSMTGVLRLTDVDTEQRLPPHPLRFVLTLEREPGAQVSRGHVRALDGGVSHPIQTNAALFDALCRYVALDGAPE